ncbi:unnamed protein product [Effrenium voratum]|nr:unnamed protein product [Effrenium voratum]
MQRTERVESELDASASDSDPDEDNASLRDESISGSSFANLCVGWPQLSCCSWVVLNTLSCLAVVASVGGTVVISVPQISKMLYCIHIYNAVELTSSIFFIIEYLVRLIASGQKCWKYATSILGIVDLLVCLIALPTIYTKLISWTADPFHAGHAFHILACLRMFRLFKLLQFVKECQMLTSAIRKDLRFIAVYLFGVFVVVLVLGSCLYAAEHSRNESSAFASIPLGMWWATVTLTTVGYGDLVPETIFGKLFASLSMLIGYGMLAVPTLIGTFNSTQGQGPSPKSRADQPQHSACLFDSRSREQSTDLLQISLRSKDFDAYGLTCAAGCLLLEEAVSLWCWRAHFDHPPWRATESHFSLLLPWLPLRPGQDVMAEVRKADAAPHTHHFMISLFVTVEGSLHRIAEGHISCEATADRKTPVEVYILAC